MEDEIADLVEDEEKAEKLSKIIENKVEEKVEKTLEDKQSEESQEEESGISRRQFMKKLGAGALGLGALSLSPASAFDIKSSDGLEVWGDGTKYLEANSSPVKVMNSDFSVGEFLIAKDWPAAKFAVDANGNLMSSSGYSITHVQGDDKLRILGDTSGSSGDSYTPNPLANFKSGSHYNFLNPTEGSNTEYFRINAGGPIEVMGTDLRLNTGQSIEDGSGNRRFGLQSTGSIIRTETGGAGQKIADDGLWHYADNGKPFIVYDNEGSFYGIRYTTSASSPGTLELTNADLHMYDTGIIRSSTYSNTYYGFDNNQLEISSDVGVSVDIDANNNGTSASFDITNDGGANTLLKINEGGTVSIPNGSLDMSSNSIYGLSQLSVGTTPGDDSKLEPLHWKLWHSSGYNNDPDVQFTMGASDPRVTDNGRIHRYFWDANGGAAGVDFILKAVETQRDTGTGIDGDEGQTVEKLRINGGSTNGDVNIVNANLDLNGNTITDSTGGPVNINADQVDGKDANDLGISAESPTDISGSRSTGTQYTNNTGSTIYVSVVFGENSYGDIHIRMTVDGVRVSGNSNNDETSDYSRSSVHAIVPDGSTYKVARDSGDLETWIEQQL